MPNRVLLTLGAGVVVAAAAAASAASLNFEAESLGAGTEIVVACQNAPIRVSWGTPTYSNNDYTLNTVILNDVDATCEGLPFKLTVADAAGDSLGESTTPSVLANAATTTITAFTPTPISVSAIEHVTLAISGPLP